MSSYRCLDCQKSYLFLLYTNVRVAIDNLFYEGSTEYKIWIFFAVPFYPVYHLLFWIFILCCDTVILSYSLTHAITSLWKKTFSAIQNNSVINFYHNQWSSKWTKPELKKRGCNIFVAIMMFFPPNICWVVLSSFQLIH